MISRLITALLIFAVAVCGKVRTKQYTDPEGCIRTYRLATGRVLTTRGLVEDPTVNSMMKKAVSAQMNPLRISETEKSADLEIRFMGGNSAGLQVDDLATGDVAMWNIGGLQPTSGKTYKKSNLVIVAVDTRSNRTIWAARCTDNFGDPDRLQERVEKAVAQAFARFPKKLVCRE